MTDKRMHTDIDAALASWARDDRVDPAAIERMVKHADRMSRRDAARSRRWLPWVAGTGAIAASIAVALMLVAPSPPLPEAPASPITAGLPEGGVAGQASFALLYTPTSDEELYL